MKLFLPLLAFCLLAVPSLAQIPDLIISEYIEGSSYNKVLEIYNGTDYVINLGTYTLELYANGSMDPNVINLGNADLSSRDVFVVANPSASAAVLGQTDLTSSLLNFSGNDALVIRRDGVVIDRLGQVGFDPLTSWNCARGSTANATLRRSEGTCAGDEDYLSAFDPCSEYEFFPTDTFDDLGQHNDDCQSVGLRISSWDALKANFK